MKNLTARELATVLAALRTYQWQVGHGLDHDPLHGAHHDEFIENIATNEGTCQPLTPDEIDDLCNKLNVKTHRQRRPDGKCWFKCTKCGFIKGFTADEMREIGDPFCDNCHCEDMQPCRRPSRAALAKCPQPKES